MTLLTGLFQAILGKAPGQNWGKMINLASKIGEINDIKQNISSKSSYFRLYYVKHTGVPLKHKCLSIILIWVIVSHIKVIVVSKKKF